MGINEGLTFLQTSVFVGRSLISVLFSVFSFILKKKKKAAEAGAFNGICNLYLNRVAHSARSSGIQRGPVSH
jgi:hypothetical protein